MSKNNTKRLREEFFNRNTLEVAKKLLGKILCVKAGKEVLKGIVMETEAYRGEDDLANHASKGRTKRTETMYLKAGTIYTYLVYGMHFCLNIVTEKENYPSAVLIRGILPIVEKGKEANVKTKTEQIMIIGPGRVSHYFGVNKSFNGLDISGNKIWLEDWGIKVSKKDITISKRIGVDYAKHCKDYFWRFGVKL